MKFKNSDMHDVGETWGNEIVASKKEEKKKHYPTIHLKADKVPSLSDIPFGTEVTVHAHGEITGVHQYNDEPKEMTIEIQEVGVKEGLNPAGFNKCVDDGGRVRTVSGPDKKHGLKAGEYIKYCFIGDESYRGEVQTKED